MVNVDAAAADDYDDDGYALNPCRVVRMMLSLLVGSWCSAKWPVFRHRLCSVSHCRDYVAVLCWASESMETCCWCATGVLPIEWESLGFVVFCKVVGRVYRRNERFASCDSAVVGAIGVSERPQKRQHCCNRAA